jgi:hypothetical protein
MKLSVANDGTPKNQSKEINIVEDKRRRSNEGKNHETIKHLEVPSHLKQYSYCPLYI